MKQIIINYFMIFILPIILGVCVRLLCRKWSKAWLITVISAVLTIIEVIVAHDPPVSGSEVYALTAVQLFCFTITSLIAGIVIRKIKKRNDTNSDLTTKP